MQKTIKEFFEYLPAGPHETAWTFCVSALGHTVIRPGQGYPPARHPKDHAFTWQRGRALAAVQIVAITSGRGRIEWKNGECQLNHGDVFILQPGVWHRYRPELRSGWTEDWVELRGATVDSWTGSGLLDVRPVGMSSDPAFWRWFADLHRVCLAKNQGYRAVAAGLGAALLGAVLAQGNVSADSANVLVSDLVRRARKLLTEGRAVNQVVRELAVSYPTLHRHFKRSTGLSPKDYACQVRLARAEDFLAGSKLSVKEIAAQLGYHSASHFSLDFKRQRGVAPSLWAGRSLEVDE